MSKIVATRIHTCITHRTQSSTCRYREQKQKSAIEQCSRDKPKGFATSCQPNAPQNLNRHVLSVGAPLHKKHILESRTKDLGIYIALFAWNMTRFLPSREYKVNGNGIYSGETINYHSSIEFSYIIHNCNLLK